MFCLPFSSNVHEPYFLHSLNLCVYFFPSLMCFLMYSYLFMMAWTMKRNNPIVPQFSESNISIRSMKLNLVNLDSSNKYIYLLGRQSMKKHAIRRTMPQRIKPMKRFFLLSNCLFSETKEKRNVTVLSRSKKRLKWRKNSRSITVVVLFNS